MKLRKCNRVEYGLKLTIYDERTEIYNMIKDKAHLNAICLMALTAVLWSSAGLLIKMIHWNAIAIAGVRSAIAALFILAIIKKPSLKFDKNKIFGSISYVSTVILFISANKKTTAANAIMLQYTAPLYVALFGHFFLKEKTKKEDWISMFFIILGMVLFFITDLNGGNVLGNCIAILSGVTFAFMTIFMRKQKDDSPLESVFWGNVFTAIIAVPFMKPPFPDMKGIGALLFLGVIQLGVAYVLYSIAIKNLTAIEAVLIPVLEPILNPVWVFIFVGEKPGKYALIGGTIVLLAVTLRSVYPLIKIKEKFEYIDKT